SGGFHLWGCRTSVGESTTPNPMPLCSLSDQRRRWVRKSMKRTLPILLALVGCYGGISPPVDPPASAPTFHKDVEPILQRSCDGCHMKEGIAPFALTDYKSAAVNAVLIA